MVLSKNEAVRILEPYLGSIWYSIKAAWQDFKTECQPIRHKICPRTRACIVNDNMVYNAQHAFQDKPDILIVPRDNTVLFQIHELILLRFKKLDELKMPQNILTSQHLGFLMQEELPGVPRGTKLFAGYELNRTETEITDITISCPNGLKTSWIHKLEAPDNAEIVKFPDGEDADFTRVRAKLNKLDDGEEKHGGSKS